jgi:hypothetical protein
MNAFAGGLVDLVKHRLGIALGRGAKLHLNGNEREAELSFPDEADGGHDDALFER